MAPPITGIMTVDPSIVPQQARIFDLDLTMRGNGIEIEYTAISVLDFGGNERSTISEELRAFLKKANRPKHPVKFAYPAKPPVREQVELSLRAPSELKDAEGNQISKPVDRVMYVICLHLKGKEAMDRFRFTCTFDPFSCSEADVDTHQSGPVFFNTYLIYDDRIEPGPGHEVAPGKIKPTTRAGFVFDYETAKKAGADFVLRFNMHCELATKSRGQSGRVREFLPIIIDPDVGHPGGNHGGPPSDP